MNFLKLKLKNFFSYGDKEQELNFENYSNLTLINGENGVGKTTLLQGILFCLYNKTRQEKVSDVVNKITQKNCKVSLYISINGVIYTFMRYRNHEEHKNAVYVFKNNENISCKNDSDTDQLILDIIKIPFIGFVNSIMLSSEIYPKFLDLQTSKRLIVLENILSLKESNLIYEKSQELLKENKTLRDEKITEISKLEYSKQKINETILNYKIESKKKILSLKEKKENLLKENSILENKLQEYNEIDIPFERKKNSIEENNKEIYKKIKLLEKEFKKDIVLSEQENSFLKEKRNYTPQQDIILLKEINKLKEEENEVILLLSKINQEILFLKKKKEETSFLIETFLKEIDSLKENKCPRCFQIIQNAKDEIFLLENKINLLNKELENSTLNTLLKEKEKLSEKQSSLQKLIFQKQTLLKEENPEKTYNEILNLLNKEKEISSIQEWNSKINSDINNLEKDIISTNNNYSEDFLNNLENEVFNLKSKIDENLKNIEIFNNSVSSLYSIEYVNSLNLEINNLNENIDSLNQSKISLDKECSYYSIISDSFSNKSEGFKKYFINDILNVLNQNINIFLPLVYDDSISFSFDKNLNESITLDNKEINFSSFSMGQKERINLSISLALFFLARTFFNNDANILFIDEFLNNLDEKGIKNIISVLESFDTKSFIISHNPNIKDLIPKVINISREITQFSVIH